MMIYLIFTLLLNQLNSNNLKGHDIDIKVTGVNNQKGEILVALFDAPEGFPLNATKAIKLAKSPAHQGDVLVHLPEVPPGKYAIALFHDVNGDAILNTNLLHIPKEGYGVSNNIRNKFSAPEFKQAVFMHDSLTSLIISINY